jgi:hypothetical protein
MVSVSGADLDRIQELLQKTYREVRSSVGSGDVTLSDPVDFGSLLT